MVESSDRQLDTVFHALSDSTRRAILREVSLQRRTVGQLAQPFAMSLAAVSKHLKVLEAAELIKRERRGSFQFVSLRAEAMKTAQQWLTFYEQFWTERLDTLQALLEGEKNE